MKKKIFISGAQAQKKIKDGIDLLVDTVKLTLGPYGRNFASGVRGGPIHASNDGVSLAKEIEGRDEFEDVAVRAVREAAIKTVDIAGDGTTTSMLLVQAIFDAVGYDPEVVSKKSQVELKNQIKQETKEVVEKLKDLKEDITSREQLIEVVKVSVEDDELAEIIGGAQWDVGITGTVMAEEHNALEVMLERINGVRIDNGFGTSRVINNQEKQTLELADMHILVTSHLINTTKKVADLKPLFDQLIARGTKGVILLARGFDDTAIGICVKNIQNGFGLYPISAPYTDMDNVMEDLAAITGAKYIKHGERNLDSVQVSDFGFTPKIVASRYEGIITGQLKGADARVDELVEKRVQDITEKLKGQISPFEKRQLETRLAQMTGGTAMIKVGAETEQERKYKKDKVDDAVAAARAAIRFGVVPGAGMALKTIADSLPDTYLIKQALYAPYNQIMANAGHVFDIPTWVKDPLQVVQVGFEKASSIARELLTTEVLVNYEAEKPMWVKQADLPKDEEDDED